MTIEYLKKCLFIVLIIALLIFAISILWYVYSFSKSGIINRSFSVSGQDKITAVPDILQFSFSVITEGGKNLVDLQKINSEKINKAIAYLKANKIKDTDIKTQNYLIEPRYENYICKDNVCPPPVIVGYTVKQIILVKVRDFDKIGNILTGIVENGANSVSDLSFTIDDSSKLENQARIEAITKAKEKAKAMAKASGFRLGKLISINESGGGLYNKAAINYGVGGGMTSEITPNIEPGSQEIVVNVNLQYEIK